MLRPLLSAVLVLSLSSPAWAGTPREALQGIFAEATRLLSDPATEERPLDRLIAVETLAADAFDFRGAAELALGRRWSGLSTTQRDEFTLLFGNLLGRSILFRAMSRARLEGGVGVQVLGEAFKGKEAMVRTAISGADRQGSHVDYRMIERDGRWKVRDLVVDGVSMAANYRAQLDRVLETVSVSDLLARMRAKVGTPMPIPGAPLAAASGPSPAAVANPGAPSAEPRTAPAAAGAASPAVAAASPAVVAASPSPAAPPGAAASAATTPAAPSPTAMPPAPVPVQSTASAASPSTSSATVTAVAARMTTRAYWLQIGAFSTAKEAETLAARFPGSRVVPTPASAGGAPLLRVRVGPFRDAADAVSELLDLQTKGYDPYLVAERY